MSALTIYFLFYINIYTFYLLDLSNTYILDLRILTAIVWQLYHVYI